MRFTSVILFSVAVLVGCQHAKPGGPPGATENAKPPRKAAANKGRAPSGTPMSDAKTSRVVPVLEFRGKVAAVNLNLRFAVIEFSLSQLPPVGQRMSVYRQGQKVGAVKISGPARDRNIAADLTAGEAQVGDEIRSD